MKRSCTTAIRIKAGMIHRLIFVVNFLLTLNVDRSNSGININKEINNTDNITNKFIIQQALY